MSESIHACTGVVIAGVLGMGALSAPSFMSAPRTSLNTAYPAPQPLPPVVIREPILGIADGAIPLMDEVWPGETPPPMHDQARIEEYFEGTELRCCREQRAFNGLDRRTRSDLMPLRMADGSLDLAVVKSGPALSHVVWRLRREGGLAVAIEAIARADPPPGGRTAFTMDTSEGRLLTLVLNTPDGANAHDSATLAIPQGHWMSADGSWPLQRLDWSGDGRRDDIVIRSDGGTAALFHTDGLGVGRWAYELKPPDQLVTADAAGAYEVVRPTDSPTRWSVRVWNGATFEAAPPIDDAPLSPAPLPPTGLPSLPHDLFFVRPAPSTDGLPSARQLFRWPAAGGDLQVVAGPAPDRFDSEWQPPEAVDRDEWQTGAQDRRTICPGADSETSRCEDLVGSPDGRRLAWTDDVALRVWNLETERELRLPHVFETARYRPLTFSPPDGRYLLVSAGHIEGGSFLVLDTRTGELQRVPDTFQYVSGRKYVQWFDQESFVLATYGTGSVLSRVMAADPRRSVPLFASLSVPWLGAAEYAPFDPHVNADGHVGVVMRHRDTRLFRANGVFHLAPDGAWAPVAALPLMGPLPGAGVAQDAYAETTWASDGSAYVLSYRRNDSDDWSRDLQIVVGLADGSAVWDVTEVLMGAENIRWGN
jgi:hypothetical protein